MQRVMAMEAEAMREKRARIIKADAFPEARNTTIWGTSNCAACVVAAENNSTTVIVMPAEFVHMAGSQSFGKLARFDV